jgi:hypothetical protein
MGLLDEGPRSLHSSSLAANRPVWLNPHTDLESPGHRPVPANYLLLKKGW